jgi:hypothetical protein
MPTMRLMRMRRRRRRTKRREKIDHNFRTGSRKRWKM